MNPASYIILSVIGLAFLIDIVYLIVSKRKGKCVGCAVSVTSNSSSSKTSTCRSCPVTNRCQSNNSCH